MNGNNDKNDNEPDIYSSSNIIGTKEKRPYLDILMYREIGPFSFVPMVCRYKS